VWTAIGSVVFGMASVVLAVLGERDVAITLGIAGISLAILSTRES